ncbi:ribonuclease H [Trifolium pratense]|uniref:Ribonuclease H n=1 Tax=Trifolium pratense TaxID=57577 RepID=A0A2K3NNA0_TRIPR|nr:ribonuclease H [Trifolium pratense]
MPTDENLCARGCSIVSWCSICHSACEMSTHLFLDCAFASAIWSWVSITLGFTVNTSFPMDLVLGCPFISSQLCELYIACIVHTLHTIWMARNVLIYHHSKVTVQAAITKIRTAVTLSCSSATGIIFHVSDELAILRNFHVDPRYGPAPLWQPPSYVGSNTGAYLGSFSCKLSSSSVLHTELMAIVLAIEKAFEHGWNKLWVESDSTIAIQVTKDHSMVPWDLRNRWSNCLSKNMQLLFSHTYREGNSCADKLANHGHQVTGFHWWVSLPSFIREEFSKDRCSLPCYRFT